MGSILRALGRLLRASLGAFVLIGNLIRGIPGWAIGRISALGNFVLRLVNRIWIGLQNFYYRSRVLQSIRLRFWTWFRPIAVNTAILVRPWLPRTRRVWVTVILELVLMLVVQILKAEDIVDELFCNILLIALPIHALTALFHRPARLVRDAILSLVAAVILLSLYILDITVPNIQLFIGIMFFLSIFVLGWTARWVFTNELRFFFWRPLSLRWIILGLLGLARAR